MLKKMAAGVALAMFSTRPGCLQQWRPGDSTTAGGGSSGTIPSPTSLRRSRRQHRQLGNRHLEGRGEITFRPRACRTTSATSSRPRS